MNVRLMMRELVLREGGYTDGKTGSSAKDSGGETNWGVTVEVARAYGYMAPMREMTPEQATDIYLLRYWIGPKFDQIGAISETIGEEVFDTGVNMGQATAAKMLQRALNVLNREGRIYPDIKADGVIGNLTIAALRAYLKHRSQDGELQLLKLLNAQQAVRYMEIAEARPKDEEFVYGWVKNRVGSLS